MPPVAESRLHPRPAVAWYMDSFEAVLARRDRAAAHRAWLPAAGRRELHALPQAMISRVLSLDDAVALVARLRAGGQVVVFTNGVYDLLHPGHVRYLQAARAEGDALIVGINSDRSVRANKGPGRPINPEPSAPS